MKMLIFNRLINSSNNLTSQVLDNATGEVIDRETTYAYIRNSKHK